MRRALSLPLALLVAAGLSCDFDSAYERYCEGNPACSDPGAESWQLRNCRGPEDCRPDGELCHPIGRVCVRTCESSDDCPPDQQECTNLRDELGGLSAQKACTCTSAQSCASSNPENTCSPVDGVCEKLCAADADCAAFDPPRFCDEASGLCLVSPVTCASNADCPTASLPRCDLSIERCSGCVSHADCAGRADGLTECEPRGSCVAPHACDPASLEPGSEGGPDVCRYGQYCPEATCVPIARGSCWGAVNLQWNFHHRGPAIVDARAAVSATSTQDECLDGGWKITAQIDFYAPEGLTYVGPEGLRNAVSFQNPTGGGPEGGRSPASFVTEGPASGARAGRIVAILCGRSDFTGWSVFLTDDQGRTGNAFCLH